MTDLTIIATDDVTLERSDPFVTTLPIIGLIPILDLDFESYGSTAELLADGVTWNLREERNTQLMALDTTVMPPGLTRSMRYHYNHPGNGCNSITTRRAFLLDQVEQEVWAEFNVRWSPNFTTMNSACLPNDHKLIFGDTKADLSSRWSLRVGTDGGGPYHNIKIQRPLAPDGSSPTVYLNRPDGAFNIHANDLWDGEWHVVRLHFRHSTTVSSNDGRTRVWFDGTLYHDEAGFNTSKPDRTSPEFLEGFSFCHNKDDGPPGIDMFLWWGRIQVFNLDPGW